MSNGVGNKEFIVEVMPEGSLEVLSKQEVERLRHTGATSLHSLLRRCALAVLNWGSETDSAVEMMEKHADFDLRILQQDHGVTLALRNAPSSAFVDGEMASTSRCFLFRRRLYLRRGSDCALLSIVTNLF